MTGRQATFRRAAPALAATLAIVVASAAALAAFGAAGSAQVVAAPAAGRGSAPEQAIPPPVSAVGLEVIGHHNLNQERNNTSDVWYMNKTAYLGYRCGQDKGSSIVNVCDPTNPQLLFQTSVMSQTFTDDVTGLHIDTASFQGDVLVEPHDRCGSGPPAIPAATRFWDVTNPANPQLLSTLVHGDGVHNSWPFLQGDRAFVVLAAPSADINDNTNRGYEDIDLDADFTIVEISDPRNPTIVSKWNAHEKVSDLQGTVFMHDVWVNRAGTLAYGAYWDAGMVLLDISDVTNPTMISRLSYLDRGEGNLHVAVPTKNEDYLILNDEDFDPTSSSFEVLAPATLAGQKRSVAGSFSDMLMGQPMAEDDLIWVGRGCSVDPAYPDVIVDDPYIHEPAGKMAVIVRGGCSFANKILRAQRAGATSAVIVNNLAGGSPPPMGGGDAAITIPGTGISHDDGNAITTTLETGTVVRAKFGVAAGEWGFTRIADYRDPLNPRLVAEFVIPETRQFPPADGNFSAHNSWVVEDTLYISHYNAGVRMVDISDPTQPRETGQLIPAGRDDGAGGTAASSVWGVVTDENGLIYLSDMTSGLWILKQTGAALPPVSCPQQATPTATSPIPTMTPTRVPTNIPPVDTPTPIPTPGGALVCPQIVGRVPAAAIQAALANPGAVYGYQQRIDPAKPAGPYNPMKLMLSIRTVSKPYHPFFNGLVYKAGCP